jgi:hypothetical protein
MPAMMTSRGSAMTQQTIIRRVVTMDRGLSFPRIVVVQPDGIAPPISFHANA